MTWRDIETAPKDGTPIRIKGRRVMSETRYEAIAVWTTRRCPHPTEDWFPATDKPEWTDPRGPYEDVTHWQPLESGT